MKGDINVKSEYGQGSTFTIEIPQKVVGEERIGDFNEKFERESRENTKYRVSFTAPEANVLAVDDTDTNIIVLQELLKQTGVNIDAAYSGVEALGYTAKKEYDLILMDQMMPEMDGTQTLAAKRKKSRDSGHLSDGGRGHRCKGEIPSPGLQRLSDKAGGRKKP